MKYPEKILLKLHEGTLARIDAAASNRSEFVRDAIGAALDGGAPKKNSIARADPEIPVVAKKVVEPVRSTVVSPRAKDILDVIALLRSGRHTSRMAERAMGLPGLRYSNAEKALLESGKVRVEGGLLVVCDEI